MRTHIRVRFIRGEEVRYISHLDLIRVFERALRRSRLPVDYSQGYNPHPRMVFGLPLPVGVTSEAEYADFKLREEIRGESFAGKLNEQLPEGLKITRAVEGDFNKNIMASVAAASYLLVLHCEEIHQPDRLKEEISGLLNRQEIRVIKEGKKGAREVDIKPMIYGLEAETALSLVDSGNKKDAAQVKRPKGLATGPLYWDPDIGWAAAEDGGLKGLFCLRGLFSAGSSANLNPELLVKAISELLSVKMEVVRIHRTGLFVRSRDMLVCPIPG